LIEIEAMTEWNKYGKLILGNKWQRWEVAPVAQPQACPVGFEPAIEYFIIKSGLT